MEHSIDFKSVRTQKLLLIPQLKQALEILGKNHYELYSYIEEQLETNPMLESCMEDKIYLVNDYDDSEENTCSQIPEFLSLKEHLLYQLNACNLGHTCRRIGEYLIDNTDESGYINIEISEVAAFFNVSVDSVNEVVSQLQKFDPPGICSRNLKECLKIQLEQMDNINKDAILIVENYLDLMAKNDVITISKESGLDMAAITDAFKLIKTLEPRPGREYFKSEKKRQVIADVIVKSIGNKYEVVLNEDAFPDVNLVEWYNYNTMFKSVPESGAALEVMLQNAIWLIKCIEQRKDIILRIAEYILKEQLEFFEKGKPFFKRTNKRHLENDLDIHDSIVAVALNGKYLQCRWGIYRFKDFFI